MLSQEESLNVVTEFLLQYAYHKVQGILFDAIRKLARIVITENVFTYERNSIDKFLVIQWDQHLL